MLTDANKQMLTFFETVKPGFPSLGTDRSGTPLLIEPFLENGAHLARFFGEIFYLFLHSIVFH